MSQTATQNIVKSITIADVKEFKQMLTPENVPVPDMYTFRLGGVFCVTRSTTVEEVVAAHNSPNSCYVKNKSGASYTQQLPIDISFFKGRVTKSARELISEMDADA